MQDRIPSTGIVRAAVLFAEFPDAQAVLSPEQVLAMISPGAEEYFRAVSYGRMEFHLEPHLEWLTLSRPAADYSAGLRDFVAHRDHIQEAVDLADAAVDFSDVDLVLVMNNPDALALPSGPTWTGYRGQGGVIMADGVGIPNGITSGADLVNWGFLWLNHEVGHLFGPRRPVLIRDGVRRFHRSFQHHERHRR